jgi:hypothetical protein
VIIAHYLHRLPSDYDLEVIRRRAAARGPQWDAKPELHFKAFLLREGGRYGAAASSYSSLYLWRHDEAFTDFVTGDGFKVVTGSFGRPAIETRTVLDARKGAAREARFAYKEELDIPLDVDLCAVANAEIERNREVAAQPGIVAATVGVDVLTWRLARIRLSMHEPTAQSSGTAYQILYLAKPLLDTLEPA